MGKLTPRRNFRSLSTPYIQTHTTHNPSIPSDKETTIETSTFLSLLSGILTLINLSDSKLYCNIHPNRLKLSFRDFAIIDLIRLIFFRQTFADWSLSMTLK